jgi:acetolactate synthase-like protein
MPKNIKLHAPAPRGVRGAPSNRAVAKILGVIASATKPVMVLGSQTLAMADKVNQIQAAVQKLGIPVFLSGMGRGLMGKSNPLQCRHNRRSALKEADLVILCGVPMDFRLEYGQGVPRRTKIISINVDKHDLYLNRWPTYPVLADPALVLLKLAEVAPSGLAVAWQDWQQHLMASDMKREKEIDEHATVKTDLLNPVHFCRKLDEVIGDNAILIGDGGDFVGTCAYTVKPRGPLGWLDPGPYGTLGIGMGFAIGAKCVLPDKEIWVLFGDGAAGYSLMEFDTLSRLGIPVIAVIGNDACWRQIERDQVEVFHDDVGCALAYTKYDEVAKALGAEGFTIEKPEDIVPTLTKARELYAQGKSVVINAKLSKHDFRKGSISL